MADLSKFRGKADNVLVRFDMHAARQRDELTPGGIWKPRNRNAQSRREATPAVVYAAGPGHYWDRWLGHDKGGSAPVGVSTFVPMSEHIKPGAKVLIDDPTTGERVYSDEFEEFRVVKAHNILAVVEE